MKNLLKKTTSKKFTAILAGISFFAGFIFLDKTITGNAIVKSANYSQTISIIGLLLIFCSLLLAYYSVKK